MSPKPKPQQPEIKTPSTRNQNPSNPKSKPHQPETNTPATRNQNPINPKPKSQQPTSNDLTSHDQNPQPPEKKTHNPHPQIQTTQPEPTAPITSTLPEQNRAATTLADLLRSKPICSDPSSRRHHPRRSAPIQADLLRSAPIQALRRWVRAIPDLQPDHLVR